MHRLSCLPLILLGVINVGTEVPPPGALRYDVMEEQPVGTVVGSLYASVRDSMPANHGVLQYSLSPAENAVVNVDPLSGLVRTSVVFDRERLCSTEYDTDCSLEPINVVIQGQGHNYYQLYKLIIRINDVNDHEPTFPDAMTSLNVSEATQPGTRLFVTAAEDADSDFYGVTEYQLQPISARQWFRADLLVQADGSQQVSLVLLQRLDREAMSSHHLTLVALDGGSPPRSGLTSVTINVVDVNDNKPRFQLDRYDASVEENVDVGTPVIQVKAFDNDEGLNGQVVYRFTDDYETQQYVDLLAIDRNTGLVSVSGRLDQEVTSQIHVIIVATDCGDGQQLSSRIHLYVTVVDVNDNVPIIKFTAASSTSSSGHQDQAHVTEGSSGGVQIGHVAVRDPDKGDNGRVKCRVDDPLFQLVRLHPSSFQLITAERATFDRELVPERRVTVVCVDNGSPALSASHVIAILIDDVNDNSPVMSKSRYAFALNETSPASTVVGTVSAMDPDRGPNGTVEYRLEPWLDGGADDVTTMFAIDRKSGVLTSSATFDFEKRQVMTFVVVASDRGQPSRSSSALVEVMLTDHNDERPVFDAASYVFETTENQPIGTLIGSVKAVDRDIDPVNRRVRYVMKLTTTTRSSPQDHIALDPITGQLTVKEKLDFERFRSLQFQIIASDSTASDATPSVCDVTIHVINTNDNAPEFIFPSATNRSVSLSASDIQVGHFVARLIGFDNDERNDARLTFDLVYGDSMTSRSFSVDPVTGIVSVVKYEPWRWPISDVKDDVRDDVYRVKLVVKVTDSGQPRRTTTGQLDVEIHTTSTVANLTRHVIHRSEDEQPATFTLLVDTHGMLIVAGGVAVGATCVILTCVAVLCVIRVYCRRTKLRRRVYNCRRNAVGRTSMTSDLSGAVVAQVGVDHSSTAMRSKVKRAVTFEPVGGDVDDGVQWRDEPRVSSPVKHSRNYCMMADCVLQEGPQQLSNLFHASTLPLTVNKDNVWTLSSLSSLPRESHFPFSGFTNDLHVDPVFSMPRHISTLDGRIATSTIVPNTGRWSTGSLTDSGRGHSEGDDVTNALYVQLLGSDPPTPITKTMLESHV